MTEIRNSILAGLAFGLLFGIFLAIRFDPYYALVVGPICGLAFGTALYFFVTSKTVKEQTQIDPDGMPILHAGAANHFVRGEGVGGKLYLLPDKLQFQSHGFNVHNHSLILDLNQIKTVSFYNSLGIIPNGFTITTLDGKTEKFIVNNRRHWKEEIEKLKMKV